VRPLRKKRSLTQGSHALHGRSLGDSHSAETHTPLSLKLSSRQVRVPHYNTRNLHTSLLPFTLFARANLGRLKRLRRRKLRLLARQSYRTVSKQDGKQGDVGGRSRDSIKGTFSLFSPSLLSSIKLTYPQAPRDPKN
jgi:hypothetical protein